MNKEELTELEKLLRQFHITYKHDNVIKMSIENIIWELNHKSYPSKEKGEK